VFDSQGNYVKTLCNVAYGLARYKAKEHCEFNAMKLANSQDVISLTSFAANIYPGGGVIWVDGKNGINCNRIYGPYVTSSNYVLSSDWCSIKSASFCEYDSEYSDSNSFLTAFNF
jgi:hypothetical protein